MVSEEIIVQLAEMICCGVTSLLEVAVEISKGEVDFSV